MRVAPFVGFGLLGLLGVFAIAVSMAGSSRAQEGHPNASADETEMEIQTTLAELGKNDRVAAEAQRWCPVTPEERLGAMGKPVKIMLAGKRVFVCCPECAEGAQAHAKATLAKVEKLKKANANMARLSPADRMLAEAQRYCAVRDGNELGSMGTPVKLMLEGEPVFVCCAGCKKSATADPKATLARLQGRESQSDPDDEDRN